PGTTTTASTGVASQPRGSSTDPDTSSSRVQLSMTLELEGIGISLIDSAPEELLYASAKRILLSVKRAGGPSTDSTVQLSVGRVQVDNHVKDGYFKTLLHTKGTTSSRRALEDLLPVMAEPSFQVGMVLMPGNQWRNIR
ncbi:hypothetical protein FOZ62_012496, partial [Perkinsus olseni]